MFSIEVLDKILDLIFISSGVIIGYVVCKKRYGFWWIVLWAFLGFYFGPIVFLGVLVMGVFKDGERS